MEKIVYIDDIDFNDKKQVIEWCLNNIDEENNEDIDEKVVNYILSIDKEQINKLDNYVRKYLQDGTKDSNPCCREKYDNSIDCLPYCLGCNDSIARLRKYFNLILNLTVQCEKMIVLIKTKNLNEEQQKQYINKLVLMCKQFLPIEQSGKICDMVLKKIAEENIDNLVQNIIKKSIN
jgi:hypothetical protein